MRQLYVIEAILLPLSWHQKIGSSGIVIPKRVLYIDSEGWFITASDQYDNEGKLWKTIATFNTYGDRPVRDAKVAIYPLSGCSRLRWSMRTSRTDSRPWCTCPGTNPMSMRAGTSTWESSQKRLSIRIRWSGLGIEGHAIPMRRHQL